MLLASTDTPTSPNASSESSYSLSTYDLEYGNSGGKSYERPSAGPLSPMSLDHTDLEDDTNNHTPSAELTEADTSEFFAGVASDIMQHRHAVEIFKMKQQGIDVMLHEGDLIIANKEAQIQELQMQLNNAATIKQTVEQELCRVRDLLEQYRK